MKLTKESRTLLSNTLMMYLLRVSGYIFPLITFPYLTRLLGAEYYGIIVLANAVIAYFKLLVEFGFTLSGTKACSLARENKEELGNIVSSIISAKLLLVVLGMLILGALFAFSNLFEGKRAILALSYLQLIPAAFITDYLFRGVEKMSVITYRTISINALYTVLILLVVRRPENYCWIPIIAAIDEVIIAAWSWVYVRGKIGLRLHRVGFKSVFGVLKDSSPYFGATIASTAYSASNVFLLNLKGFSDAEVGNFGVASNLITTLQSMMSPIHECMYPYMVVKKNYKLIKRVILVGVPVVALGCTVLFIYSDWVINLLSGDGYEAAVRIFRTMLPAVVVTFASYLLGYSTLGAMGKVKYVNLSVMITAAFHIIALCVMWMTGWLNLVSVAVLTVCSESIILTIRLFYVNKFRSGKT